MTPNEPNEPREYTPEELRKIYAKFQKEFTPEKLIEYIEDDDEKVPMEQILADAEELVRKQSQHREP